ncbi:MAG: hypothetical protein JST80_01655 [Bdellovibrionales bacterium]|nr:hypothetical protein [Bdellovibrionales bacterium]
MKFNGYYHEKPHRDLDAKIQAYNNNDHKTDVWNAFVDSDLPGVNDDDFSIIPRTLPMSYWPTLKESAHLVTRFALALLSLPEREIRAIIPRGPVRDHLVDELEVLKYRKGRMTGSFRYDMAIVGPPVKGNPPVVLEINEIGFDGLARSSFFQKVLLDLMPNLKGRLVSLDTAAAEVRNMQRLGDKMIRIQYDDYNWDEIYLLQAAQKLGADFKLISPKLFGQKISKKHSPLLEQLPIDVVNGRVVLGGGGKLGQWRPDATNMSFAYELKDYKEGHPLYSKLVRAKTPQYGPFITGLVAAKTILVLMDDPLLRKKLLGSSKTMAESVLPAKLLSSPGAAKCLQKPHDWVLKHTDGCGGEQVFMNQDLERKLKRIRSANRHEWVIQKKTELNLIDVNGILSRPKQAIADLGVFVQYDWEMGRNGGRFRHFEIGGLMARATNKSLKVNVSGGGLQVAMLLDRAK